MVNEDRPARAGNTGRARRRALRVTIGAGVLTVPITLPSAGVAASPQPANPVPITAQHMPGTQPDERLYAQDVLNLVNRQRTAHACRPLVVNIAIAKAAQDHSVDMGVNGYFAHDTPAGVTPWTRMEQAGYTQPAAENIAVGYRTPQEVVDGWIGSPAHRANILNCSYKATGIGYYDGASVNSPISDATVNKIPANGPGSEDSGPWWTEDFGFA